MTFPFFYAKFCMGKSFLCKILLGFLRETLHPTLSLRDGGGDGGSALPCPSPCAEWSDICEPVHPFHAPTYTHPLPRSHSPSHACVHTRGHPCLCARVRYVPAVLAARPCEMSGYCGSAAVLCGSSRFSGSACGVIARVYYACVYRAYVMCVFIFVRACAYFLCGREI